ncbi:MAG TPA: hypothetical protein VGM53_26340 [Streptosporangiaceae bacterium]|jgi:hypothetical protein
MRSVAPGRRRPPKLDLKQSDQHLNELVRLGVDGITTANLAILQALR